MSCWQWQTRKDENRVEIVIRGGTRCCIDDSSLIGSGWDSWSCCDHLLQNQ